MTPCYKTELIVLPQCWIKITYKKIIVGRGCRPTLFFVSYYPDQKRELRYE